ncbi:MAG TPA: peptidylprolyl isomerase [Burkholderiales bacterium]|nr:peptidylprolyl isomerase [Burkholderiales bacterium]
MHAYHHRFLKPLALASTLFLLPALAFAQAPVAKVNGVAIPQAKLDAIIKARAASKQPDTPEVRTAIRETLINQEAISQEAVKKGIDKQPEIATQLELQRQEVLVNAFVQDYMKANPITDDALRKEYERVKPTIPAKEVKARHILVEKEDEAKDIIAQLKKGANFEKLAAAKSNDTGSKTRGGDLDWGPAQRYPKPFGEALSKLKKGQLTDTPVQTESGWHVIRLDDERATNVPTFEQAKPQIQQMMQGQQVQKMLAEVRAKAKVE